MTPSISFTTNNIQCLKRIPFVQVSKFVNSMAARLDDRRAHFMCSFDATVGTDMYGYRRLIDAF
jgi:hypothetical protein